MYENDEFKMTFCHHLIYHPTQKENQLQKNEKLLEVQRFKKLEFLKVKNTFTKHYYTEMSSFQSEDVLGDSILKPKMLRTRVESDGSIKTTLVSIQTQSNVSPSLRRISEGSAVYDGGIRETTFSRGRLPSLRKTSCHLPSLSSKPQQPLARLPSFRSRSQRPQLVPLQSLKSRSQQPLNIGMPSFEYKKRQEIQKLESVKVEVPRLAPNSKWKIVGKRMNLGVHKDSNDIADIFKLARAYHKARAGIFHKDESVKQQTDNMVSKSENRKMAVMVLSCMIEADLPYEFYDQIGHSKQIKQIIRSFVGSSDVTKELLETLCEETEEESVTSSGLSEASELSEILSEKCVISEADVNIQFDV